MVDVIDSTQGVSIGMTEEPTPPKTSWALIIGGIAAIGVLGVLMTRKK